MFLILKLFCLIVLLSKVYIYIEPNVSRETLGKIFLIYAKKQHFL